MQLLLMMVICLAFFPYNPTVGYFSPEWSAILTWLGVALVGAMGEVHSWFFAWQIRHRPERRPAMLRWYHRYRYFHVALMLTVYLGALFGLGWGTIVRRVWGLEHWILVDELLILAPFLIALILEWQSFYRVERALAEASAGAQSVSFWGRWAYLWYHVRHYLSLVLAPILLFTAIHETLLTLLPSSANEIWFQLASLGLLILIILFITPWLLTVLWSAHSLPPGTLRDRLEACANRLRFRYTDILLWNTRGGVANAMVTGMFRVPRYVLLSDALLQGLKPEEVEAVFGHEIGHVKHHHMAYYLGFMMLSLYLLGNLANLFLPPIPSEDAEWLVFLADWSKSFTFWSSYLAAMAFLGGYVWLVFGFLSRRCERQADVYGCRAVSCANRACEGHDGTQIHQGDRPGLCPTGIRTFIHALERVADLNGIRRDKPSWRHSSIARRVAFLENLLNDPAIEPRFQKRLAVVKWGLLVGLAALLVALVPVVYHLTGTLLILL